MVVSERVRPAEKSSSTTTKGVAVGIAIGAKCGVCVGKHDNERHRRYLDHKNEYQKRRYHTDPEFRARLLERNRGYIRKQQKNQLVEVYDHYPYCPLLEVPQIVRAIITVVRRHIHPDNPLFDDICQEAVTACLAQEINISEIEEEVPRMIKDTNDGYPVYTSTMEPWQEANLKVSSCCSDCGSPRIERECSVCG